MKTMIDSVKVTTVLEFEFQLPKLLQSQSTGSGNMGEQWSLQKDWKTEKHKLVIALEDGPKVAEIFHQLSLVILEESRSRGALPQNR